MREQVDATLSQASVFAPGEEGLDLEAKFAQSKFKGLVNYTPFQDILRAMTKAISDERVCEIVYRTAQRLEGNSFLYAPKRLVAFHEVIYFKGWIMEGRRPRYERPTLLALQRIISAAPTNRSSSFLPALPKDEGGEAFGLMACETFSAKIRFEADAALYIEERRWSEGQKITRHEDGRITLALRSSSPEELVAWALSFGDAAEVLSPSWLRKMISERVAAIARRYSTPETGD
jgi:predicted DNA-binding transcriptional regulator YafY